MSTKKAAAQGRSNALRAKTREVIWARAAGRCQYRGCNHDLIGDVVAGNEDAKFGFVAHIVSDSPNGPRGDSVRSHLLADDVSNLMLLCHPHHKLVDEDGLEDHPEDLMLAMKAAHEARIATVVDIQEDRASHVLIYTANVGQHSPPVAYKDFSTVILPERYPAEKQPIQLELVGSETRDTEPSFWAQEALNLRRRFAFRVRERVENREIRHLTVFAIAPQPLLVELGHLLGDITDVDVRQLHREPKGWRWADDAPAVQFEIRRPKSFDGRPALVLGISATINDDRVLAALGPDASIWSIRVEQPHNDIMRRRDDLRAFRCQLRAVLNEIKAAHGEAAGIAVFPAVPVSAAVEIGRVWMPKADSPLVIYDQNRVLGGFVQTLTIQQDDLQNLDRPLPMVA